MLYTFEIERFHLEDETIVLIEQAVPCNDIFEAIRTNKVVLFKRYSFYNELVNNSTRVVRTPAPIYLNGRSINPTSSVIFKDNAYRVSADDITITLIMKYDYDLPKTRSTLFKYISSKIMKNADLKDWLISNTVYKTRKELYTRFMNDHCCTRLYTYDKWGDHDDHIPDIIASQISGKSLVTLIPQTHAGQHITVGGNPLVRLTLKNDNNKISITLQPDCISTDTRKKLLEEVGIVDNGKQSFELTHEQCVKVIKIGDRGYSMNTDGYDEIKHILYVKFYRKYITSFNLPAKLPKELKTLGIQRYSVNVKTQLVKYFWNYTTGDVLDAAVNNIIEMYGGSVLFNVHPPKSNIRLTSLNSFIEPVFTHFNIAHMNIDSSLINFLKPYVMISTLYKHYDMDLRLFNFAKRDETLTDRKLAEIEDIISESDTYFIFGPLLGA